MQMSSIRIFTTICLAMFFTILIGSAQSTLLPPPQEVEALPGTCQLTRPLQIDHPLPRQLEPLLILDLLKGHFSEDSTSSLILKLSLLSNQDFRNDEAYHLEIQPDEVTLTAAHPAGLFYGVQTLLQLKDHYGTSAVPCQRILDWPDLEHRVVMDDISRGPIPNTAYLKSQIQRLASLKINGLTFYIEDIVKTNVHGSFAPRNGIDLEEFKLLSDFAAGYNIELIGSFQSLGHFEKILQHPQYRSLGITERMLDPTSLPARKFLTEVQADMLSAFSSNYFNINGDEAWDLSRGVLKPLADSLGAGIIYARHMVPLLQNLIRAGKKPMMWADMLLEHPEAFTQIPKSTTLLTWDYSDRAHFNDWIDPIASRNLNFWICPGILNSNRFMPDFEETFGNIDGFVREGYAKGAKGMMLTVWDDGGRHFFQRDWPGVVAGAARSWHVDHTLESKEMEYIWSFPTTDDSSHFLANGVAKLGKLKKFSATQSMTNAFIRQPLIPEYGANLTFDLTDHKEIEMLCDSATALFDQAPSHPDLRSWQFTAEQLKLIAFSKRELVALSSQYQALCFDQISRPEKVSSAIEEIILRAKKLGSQWQQLGDEFESLWFIENRDHWTEEAISLYAQRNRRFYALVKRLEQAALNFNSAENNFLPVPEQVQLGINETSSGYFTYWLLNGPYRIEAFSPPFADFLEPSGGETQVQPIPGDWQIGTDGTKKMWMKHQSIPDDQIDLRAYYGDLKGAVVYAYAQIESSLAQEVLASLGSNDGISVMLNGELVFDHQHKRSLIIDEDRIKLRLLAGTNHLVLKISQWKSAWGFSFRLPTEKVSNRKHKYVIQE